MSYSTEPIAQTPMMLQWQACKQTAGEAILLFRMGDFYEAFYEDAVLLARELDLTLTRRQDIPMSGVPHHSSESYIDKLISKGYRVAIAEQTEDPKKAKGLVRREIVRVVTPGTLINSSLLSDKSNNFVAAITRIGTIFGISVLDVTTSEFKATEFENERDFLNELHRLKPAEILTSIKFNDKHSALLSELKEAYACLITLQDDWSFDHQVAHDFLLDHFKVHNLDGFGLKGMLAAINASGSLLYYLKDRLCLPTEHVRELSTYHPSDYLNLDKNTQRNLELVEPLNDHNSQHTLCHLLDQTKTPMGARLLKQWVKQPLLSVDKINQRQDAIQAFLSESSKREQLNGLLDSIRDLERLMMRVSSGYASPRDLLALCHSLKPIHNLKALLYSIPTALILTEAQKLDPLPHVIALIENAIIDEPPLKTNEGNIFREGYNSTLDELRKISQDSHSWIANYQTDLRDNTGIKTLKVGYTRMFGYYIEVSKGQAERMPDTFQRRQTLTNAERFITPELKDFETKMLTAQERLVALESELFTAIRLETAKYASIVMRMAQAIAQIDCLVALANVAYVHHYVRPDVDLSSVLHIIDGRHPIIEANNSSEKFVPNDTIMDDQDNRLFLITGPNMAGKSTYIRQVALIVIMAQIGSFVPAKSAHIGLVDKVFCRIGASDNLSRGQSTFMVEMTETANILNHATSRSLVILDEIGRGTSTYDGIAIAWSVAEHLLLTEGQTAKTLFATHYWELTKLEGKIQGAVNYNVAVQENAENIIFLRKIIKGGTDRSYGIHVARLAGIPTSVLSRAKEILLHLEENANRKTSFEPSIKISKTQTKQKSRIDPHQLSFLTS